MRPARERGLHKFIYYVNLKAGSSAVQARLTDAFERSVFRTDAVLAADFRAACKGDHKYRSGCFPVRDTRDFFAFSVARDPVAKFESGVRQAWIHNPGLRNLTADDMLDKALADGAFPDLHLEPSTWAMTGTRKGGAPGPNVSFVAKVETLDADWRALVDRIRPRSVSADQRDALLEPLPTVNARAAVPRSRLSDAAVRRMCRSDMFGDEWRCLDYDLPAPCRASSSG